MLPFPTVEGVEIANVCVADISVVGFEPSSRLFRMADPRYRCLCPSKQNPKITKASRRVIRQDYCFLRVLKH